jgi:Acetyltransferase (GNAT) domain
MQKRKLYETSVYKHPKEFPPDVADLFHSNLVIGFENSPAWLGNLIDTVYPNDPGVSIFVLRKNGSAVASLPLRITKTRFGEKVDSLSNYYTALYAPITLKHTDAADMTALIKAVRISHPHLTRIRLSPMDPAAPGFGLLWEAFRVNGWVPTKFFCFGNWFLPVAQPWRDYLANRDGAVRNTIRRMGKKFTGEGGTIELTQDDTQLARSLAAYQQVYAASWKPPEAYDRFIPGLIRTCSANGWLRLGIAWLHGKPIAAQLWIVCAGKANIFKLAYDQEFKAFAPGTLLTAALMEQVLQYDQVAEVDYLMGDDAYKQQWMHQRRERWGLTAYNPKSLAGVLDLGKETIARTIKAMMKPFFKPRPSV